MNVEPVRGARKLAYPTCWEWQGSRDRKGYGRVWRPDRLTTAHRHAWTLEHGEVPATLFVLHRCDNRRCVRPDHLFLGTNSDNMIDMVVKGRADNRGERNNNARLTDEEIAEIRTRYRPQVNGTLLAREYGVSLSTIMNVIAASSGRYRSVIDFRRSRTSA
jgi:hypothetical protein